MSRSYEIFATREDLSELLEAVESVRPIIYIRTGLSDSRLPEIKTSSSDIKDLGVACFGDQNLESIFLVMDRGYPVSVRSVPQRRGRIKYAIDQLKNPKSIAVKVGGEYRGEALIAGQIGTASSDEVSLSLLRLFGKEIRRRFEKIQAYWVGKGAARALDSGLRLTANITAPREADLQRIRK